MRELIQLQVHLRDFAGFEETSRKLLILKPSVMTNWVALAAACLFNRNYSGCLQAVETIIKFQEETTSKSRMQPYEANEIVFLALRAFHAQDRHAEALAFLKKHAKYVVD